jgi:hypothetical protein
MDIYWHAKKEMFGIRPTGEPVTITGFDLFRIGTDSKIAELWQQFNVGSWP